MKPHRLFSDPGVSGIHVDGEIPVGEKNILFPEPSVSHPERNHPLKALFVFLIIKAGIVPGIQKDDEIPLAARVQKGAHGKRVCLTFRLFRRFGG